MPKKSVQLAKQLGRPDAHVLSALTILDDKDETNASVRGAIETLSAQLKDDSALITPHATNLFAALCSRLNALLSDSDLSVTKKLIALAMECFSRDELLKTLKEMQLKYLVLQMLDRLVDRRISTFARR